MELDHHEVWASPRTVISRQVTPLGLIGAEVHQARRCTSTEKLASATASSQERTKDARSTAGHTAGWLASLHHPLHPSEKNNILGETWDEVMQLHLGAVGCAAQWELTSAGDGGRRQRSKVINLQPAGKSQ